MTNTTSAPSAPRVTATRLNTQRKYLWERPFNDYINNLLRANPPFKYGEHDCCTLISGAIDAMTEDTGNPMKEFLGHYSTEIGAGRQTRKYGGLYRILRGKFGKPVHGARGQRGDIAFVEGSCGLIMGPYALFLHEEGFAYVRLSKVQRAFRIQ